MLYVSKRDGVIIVGIHVQDPMASDAGKRRPSRCRVQKQEHVEEREDNCPDRCEEEESGTVALIGGEEIMVGVEPGYQP